MNHPIDPPGCLCRLRTSPAQAPDLLLDTLTDWPNRFYSLGCRCGSELFSVVGELAENALIRQTVVAGPVTCRCNRCLVTVPIFDPARHGYDVEINHFPSQYVPSGVTKEFRCPTCRQSTFALIARFEYPARLIASLEAGLPTGYVGHPGREQELFTWFTLIGRCGRCDAVTTVASACCA